MSIKSEHFPRIASQLSGLDEDWARESIAASLALKDDGRIELSSISTARGYVNRINDEFVIQED